MHPRFFHFGVTVTIFLVALYRRMNGQSIRHVVMSLSRASHPPSQSVFCRLLRLSTSCVLLKERGENGGSQRMFEVGTPLTLPLFFVFCFQLESEIRKSRQKGKSQDNNSKPDYADSLCGFLIFSVLLAFCMWFNLQICHSSSNDEFLLVLTLYVFVL